MNWLLKVDDVVLNFFDPPIKIVLETLDSLVKVGLDAFVIEFITSTFLILQLRNGFAQAVDMTSKFFFFTFLFLVEADELLLQVLSTVYLILKLLIFITQRIFIECFQANKATF